MNHADTAAKLVLGDRNNSYGDPASDFGGTALMWTGLLSEKLAHNLTARDVALMMMALKLRRHAHKPKDDNLVDLHGYALCLEWIERAEKPTPATHALEGKIFELTQCIEDVATGGKLTCPTCHKTQPCLCGNTTLPIV